jgi:hypothetical protein
VIVMVLVMVMTKGHVSAEMMIAIKRRCTEGRNTGQKLLLFCTQVAS